MVLAYVKRKQAGWHCVHLKNAFYGQNNSANERMHNCTISVLQSPLMKKKKNLWHHLVKMANWVSSRRIYFYAIDSYLLTKKDLAGVPVWCVSLHRAAKSWIDFFSFLITLDFWQDGRRRREKSSNGHDWNTFISNQGTCISSNANWPYLSFVYLHIWFIHFLFRCHNLFCQVAMAAGNCRITFCPVDHIIKEENSRMIQCSCAIKCFLSA